MSKAKLIELWVQWWSGKSELCDQCDLIADHGGPNTYQWHLFMGAQGKLAQTYQKSDSETEWTYQISHPMRCHGECLRPSGCENSFVSPLNVVHSNSYISQPAAALIHITSHPLLGPAFYHHKTDWSVEETSVFERRQNGKALLSSNTYWLGLSAHNLRSVIHVVTEEKRNIIKAVRILLLVGFFATIQNIT